jgi:hypothetical protein
MKRIVPYLLLIAVCASVSLADYSDGFITAGEYEYGVDWNSYDPPLIVDGGGADWIEMRNFGRLEVRYTSIPLSNSGGIWDIVLLDGDLIYLGGETEEITITENAEAVLTGGRIDYITSFQDSDLTKHITFIADLDSIDLTGNLLTGDWLNAGGSFSITLLDQAGYDSVYSNINFVPEPATLLLFGLGGLMLRRKR